ncbi:hypothetical protein AQUCO_01400058v1 [Aquilegia coerulea]|uniref:SUN domain-containing protein n=1 Tax=Aquilegia coerulea TaxID=218851 RepID=A0A2G5DU86_AQUCA|nr:hypothetical protein AQUCO_01400058v1 [Aquilegia coerulea]PIA47094.1 hypothetical protein AQUCO_01400058v1 [Aquilegia coerulea]
MQRSRRALLQRRALENAISGKKHRLYKVTLSLVIVLWGIVFLLNLWISHGDNYTDGSGLPANETSWHETELKNGSDAGVEISDFGKSGKRSDFSSSVATSSESEFCSTESSLSVENECKVPAVEDKVEVETSASSAKLDKEIPKSERLSRAAPLGLDEFKSRASSPKGKPVTGRAGSITHRLETGGAEHNYASASKGAKVLAFNKEAKGASNVLGKNKDKYLRNPCSAEEKFVIIELSEETLVDTIEIANFEHHSSNLKDFELLGSLAYPTDRWVSLGNFTAGNVKHAQRFILQDPKWVRYLKLDLLSHYGSEFYCTVSSVEVYGVDAVERMLEDLISDQEPLLEPEKPMTEPMTKAMQTDIPAGDELYQELDINTNDDSAPEKSSVKSEVQKNNAAEAVLETRPQQAGRMPGDTALKILMQKVRSLDLNLLILERYMEELNSRYGSIFKELDDEIAAKDQHLERMRSELKKCADSNEVNAKDVAELITWKSLVSMQVDNLVRDNAVLRSEVKMVLDNQSHMESKGLAIFLLSLFFGCLAFINLFIDMLTSVFRIPKSGNFCGVTSSWLFLLVCTIIVIILVL